MERTYAEFPNLELAWAKVQEINSAGLWDGKKTTDYCLEEHIGRIGEICLVPVLPGYEHFFKPTAE